MAVATIASVPYMETTPMNVPAFLTNLESSVIGCKIISGSLPSVAYVIQSSTRNGNAHFSFGSKSTHADTGPAEYDTARGGNFVAKPNATSGMVRLRELRRADASRNPEYIIHDVVQIITNIGAYITLLLSPGTYEEDE